MYLSFNVKDKDTSITDLQQHLTSIRNWCFNNSLLINPDKTKLIVFGTKQMLSRLDAQLPAKQVHFSFQVMIIMR